MRPMPTVEQLVQVFKDRGWKPTPRVGAMQSLVHEGRCCAVPALIAIADPEWLDKFTECDMELTPMDIYGKVRSEYGREAGLIHYGFDDPDKELRYPWIQLGADLYNALTSGDVNDNNK